MKTIMRNPRVTGRALSDGTGVLLHLDTSAYHGLNKTGWKIWSLLESGMTFDQLVGRMGAEIGRPVPALSDDMRRFIDGMAARGLVLIESQAVEEPVAAHPA